MTGDRARGRDREAWLVVLAVAGFAVSSYLTAFQLGLIAAVWDPIFGQGSERVLTSAISRILPVPDASLGALVYLVDAVLAASLLAGLGARHVVVAALAVIASLGALSAIGLVVLQPIVVGSFCSLCLTSAAISVLLAVGSLSELRTSNHHRSPVDQRSTGHLKEARQ